MDDKTAPPQTENRTISRLKDELRQLEQSNRRLAVERNRILQVAKETSAKVGREFGTTIKTLEEELDRTTKKLMEYRDQTWKGWFKQFWVMVKRAFGRLKKQQSSSFQARVDPDTEAEAIADLTNLRNDNERSGE